MPKQRQRSGHASQHESVCIAEASLKLNRKRQAGGGDAREAETPKRVFQSNFQLNLYPPAAPWLPYPVFMITRHVSYAMSEVITELSETEIPIHRPLGPLTCLV